MRTEQLPTGAGAAAPPAPAARIGWAHAAILLALPWLLLAINPNWPFQGLGHMDPWYYFGHFIHFPHYQQIAPSYAGERLPWILPGFILTRAFTPPYGAMALSILTFWVSLFSLYSIVRRFADTRSALLTACLTGCLPGFIGANGWSYIDGPSIAYMLLSYACLAKSARTSRPSLYLVLGGMSWAALVYTYIAWVIFTPVCVLLHLAGQSAQRCAPTSAAERVSSVVRPIGWFVLGVMITTAVLSGVHHVLFGSRLFFFYRNIRQTLFAGAAMKPWSLDDYAWIPRASWIVLPGLASLLAAGVLVRRTRLVAGGDRAVLAVAIACLYSVLAMVVMTLGGTHLLEMDYFADVLLPAVVLLFGLTAWRVPASVGFAQWLVVLLAACLISSGGLWKPGLVALLLSRGPWWPWLIGLAAVAVWLAGRGRRSAWAVSVLFLALASFALTPAYAGSAWRQHYDGRAAYARVAEGVKLVDDTYAGRGHPTFWFDNFDGGDPFTGEYRGLMCAFLAHLGSMQHYPRVDRRYPPGTTLVVVRRERDVWPEASARMATAGMPVTLVAQHAVGGASPAYWLTFVRVTSPPRGTP